MLLFMLVKIVTPVPDAVLKIDLETDSDNQGDISNMLQNVKIPMFLLQTNKAYVGDLI